MLELISDVREHGQQLSDHSEMLARLESNTSAMTACNQAIVRELEKIRKAQEQAAAEIAGQVKGELTKGLHAINKAVFDFARAQVEKRP